MTAAILLGGLVAIAALALAMVRPAWRLPALAFALLAVPGNVDDLLPQMVLDYHQLPDATAPIVSVVDLLLAWGVILSLRERRGLSPGATRLVGAAIVLAAGAAIVAAGAGLGGVEPGAVVRGIVVFARIPALLYLADALHSELGDGTKLGVAILLGGIVVIGNGAYTTITTGPDRFTATTFGRNGLAITLVVVVVVAAGLAYRWWRNMRAGTSGDSRAFRWIAPLAVVVGSVSLFGAAATGTRMALLVLIAAGLGALVVNPSGFEVARVRAILATLAVAFVVLLASVTLTSGGERTVSVFTEPDTTVDIVTQPGNVQSDAALRSRGHFWDLALRMARAEPIDGVGPFQWNIRRYEIDPGAPEVVVDTHDTYLQIAAEYGLIVAAGYLALLAVVLATIAWRLRNRAGRATLGWAGLAIVIGAFVLPVAALTNSHLFNVRNGALEWLMIGAALALTAGLSGRSSSGRDVAARAE